MTSPRPIGATFDPAVDRFTKTTCFNVVRQRAVTDCAFYAREFLSLRERVEHLRDKVFANVCELDRQDCYPLSATEKARAVEVDSTRNPSWPPCPNCPALDDQNPYDG